MLHVGWLSAGYSKRSYMRGLIFGAGYGSVTLFTIIGYGIYWPFIHLRSKIWGTGIISCELWYLLSSTPSYSHFQQHTHCCWKLVQEQKVRTYATK